MTTSYPLPPVVDVVRTLDATHLNAVANDPEVRPWLGGDGVLDLSSTVADPWNVSVVTEHGGFIALWASPERYEIHSLFMAAGRGREAIRAMRAGLDYLFAATDATELVTKVPQGNAAALGLARLAGFTRQFTSRIPWGAELVPVDFMSLSAQTWALRSRAALALGEWFHASMTDAMTQRASTLPPHSDADDAHDRMAGAAVLMCRAGNARKAESFYNAWARFVGYPLIRVLAEHPVVLDLEGLIVECRASSMEILKCL